MNAKINKKFEVAEDKQNLPKEPVMTMEERIDLELVKLIEQAKKDYSHDTHHGITWNEFKRIVKSYGFELGFRKKFIGTTWVGGDSKEEENIFFHKEKGLILYAESFSTKFVYKANVYGELKINENELSQMQRYALASTSHGTDGDRVYFKADVREGLYAKLDSISASFEFAKQWKKLNPFFNLSNSFENQTRKVTREKLKESSSEVCSIVSIK